MQSTLMSSSSSLIWFRTNAVFLNTGDGKIKKIPDYTKYQLQPNPKFHHWHYFCLVDFAVSLSFSEFFSIIFKQFVLFSFTIKKTTNFAARFDDCDIEICCVVVIFRICTFFCVIICDYLLAFSNEVNEVELTGNNTQMKRLLHNSLQLFNLCGISLSISWQHLQVLRDYQI